MKRQERAPYISVIIPFKKKDKYLLECLENIRKQSYQDFEVICLPDNKEVLKGINVRIVTTGDRGPAEKRDIGAMKAKGEILAFIDNDAYPEKNWLKNAVVLFKDKKISAVCGPGITPPNDYNLQKAGGFVNSLWFGSGGAGTYRFIQMKRRYVDDYPSMNFLVRKNDFERVGGFDTHFWPGEDTKLCNDLVYILEKKIIYDPKVLVYHHRKPLFIPHLKQISRFAIHRGHFAKILPNTSLRLGYLIPTIFTLFLMIGLILSLISVTFRLFYLTILLLYLLLLTGNIFYVTVKSGSISVSVYTGIGIVLTHIIYGLLFPVGFIRRTLKQ